MVYRRLGKSDVRVSLIGFGASPLGNVFGPVSAEDARETVACAIDAGINLFDVSPYYGNRLAEERLGDALRGRRNEVVLATKCGRYGVDAFDFSAERVTRGFEDSLRLLRTEYVDLLQVHDVEFGSADQIVNETLPALRRLQQQGKCRLIGITGYWPNYLAKLASMSEVDVVLNYCHWNYLMSDMDVELTPRLRQSGIALLNASPLHMGLLGGAVIPEWHPAPDRVRIAANRFVQFCLDQGEEPSTVAIAKCLTHEYAASTLIGFRTREEVQAASSALLWQGSSSFMQRLSDLLADVQNISWSSGKLLKDVDRQSPEIQKEEGRI